MRALWKPIETAPMDTDEPVLLYCPGINSWNRKPGLGEIVVGIWEPFVLVRPADHSYHFDGGGWYSDIGDVEQGYESTGSYFVHEPLRPTHWMPLPKPPTER